VIQECLDRTCRALDMDVDQLACRRRHPEVRELRELVAVLGVERFEQRVPEMAAVLQKNPGSVSRWVSTAAEARSSDPASAKHLRGAR